MTLLHATCVTIDQAGVLIRGESGAGKSDLALRLIDRGAMLVADDYCEASVSGGALVVKAPATITGKIEVRGYGIVDLPAIPSAMIALVVDLMDVRHIPRLPETNACVIAGITLPRLCLDASLPSAAARVRLALSQAGRGAATRP